MDGEIAAELKDEDARLRRLLKELDELDGDLSHIGHLGDVVRHYRDRVEQLERDLESSSKTGDSKPYVLLLDTASLQKFLSYHYRILLRTGTRLAIIESELEKISG